MEPTSGDAPTIEQWNGISPSLRGFCHERRGSSGDDEPSPEKGDAPKRTKFRPKLAPPPLQSAEGSGADAVLSPKVVETMRQLHLTPLRGKEQPGGGAYQPRKEEPSGARGVSEADEETAEPARGRHPRQAPTEPNEIGPTLSTPAVPLESLHSDGSGDARPRTADPDDVDRDSDSSDDFLFDGAARGGMQGQARTQGKKMHGAEEIAAAELPPERQGAVASRGAEGEEGGRAEREGGEEDEGGDEEAEEDKRVVAKDAFGCFCCLGITGGLVTLCVFGAICLGGDAEVQKRSCAGMGEAGGLMMLVAFGFTAFFAICCCWAICCIPAGTSRSKHSTRKEDTAERTPDTQDVEVEIDGRDAPHGTAIEHARPGQATGGGDTESPNAGIRTHMDAHGARAVTHAHPPRGARAGPPATGVGGASSREERAAGEQRSRGASPVRNGARATRFDPIQADPSRQIRAEPTDDFFV